MTSSPRFDLLAVAMGVAFSFMWSSAFSSARIIVAEAPPMLSLALRFAISGALAVAIAAALGQTIRLTRQQWAMTAVFGICQNALYLGLYFIAMQTVPASVATITASTMPLLVALLGWAFLGQRPPLLGWIGLGAGLAGVALILGHRISGGADAFGLVLCGLGVTALAVATLAMRGASSGGNLLMIVGLQMWVGAAALALAGGLTETWEVTWTPRLVGALAYTTVVPGLIATFVWFWLVQRIGAVRAATYHFLNPVFGVAVAAVLLGEELSLWDLAGVLVVAAGILCVQLARPRRSAG
ncbi:DMT family transporter [Mangrovicoccus algicola]|uniref:DMT family transporter n=1 Tax=Mangrovicoccus algicola TaxID=2771008 RepID=A0A8J6Z8F8_9RHOB|nr:DMT family transporter [Mangrovicoccus algicola]MBE3638300.1 DMT family transporter [Mangrovicoccus algicola]